MADPSVTYSFTNGEVASAPNVNANFTDILNSIRSGSTADLGCGSLKINTVPFASAVVSAIQSASVNQLTIVNTFSVGTISATAGQFTAATVGGVTVASAAISQIIAYDFTSTVEGEMSYAAGTFTATVSGCSGTNTFDAKYEKIKNQVFLHFPEFSADSDGSAEFIVEGLPSVIHPSPTGDTLWLTGNPMGYLTNPLPTHWCCPRIPKSNVSVIYMYNEAGFWDVASPKGWTGDRVLIYSI